MDTAALVLKGLTIAEQLWENRDLALQAIQSVRRIIDRDSEPTPADLATTEAELDALLGEFNSPLPSE